MFLIFNFLLLTLFWQTRLSFFKNQIVDYLTVFFYFSDLLILVLLVLLVTTNQGSKFFEFLRQPRFVKLHALFSLFFVLAFLSNFSVLQPLSAWYRLAKLVLFYLFSFLIAFLASTQSRPKGKDQAFFWQKTFAFLNAGLFLETLIALGEWIKQASLGLQLLGEWRFSVLTPGIAKVLIGSQEFLRPYATFPHPNVLGGILAIVAACDLHFFLSNKTYTRLSLFYFLLFSLSLFLTFSRSAWLVYLILVVLVLGYNLRFKTKLRLFFKPERWLLILAIASPLILVSPLVWQRLYALQTIDQPSVERRWELNQAALAMFRQRPLLGVGVNQFVPNLEKYVLISGPGRFLQPVHNLYLLILTEHGILGLLVFFGFLFLLFKPFLFPACRVPRDGFPILLIWLGIFIISFFDHYFWTLQAGQLFFWLSIGLTLFSF